MTGSIFDNIDTVIDTQGSGKKQYFASGAVGYKMPLGLPKETAEAWEKEYALCNCATCQDIDCKCRHKNIRFSVDAGGQNQCLRLMQSKTRYVFRNAIGLVIEIPPEIVKAIREGGTE